MRGYTQTISVCYGRRQQPNPGIPLRLKCSKDVAIVQALINNLTTEQLTGGADHPVNMEQNSGVLQETLYHKA